MRKKKKNIPELRFPEFSGEWEIKMLGELGTFFSGGTPLTTKRQYFDGTIPFIRSGEINSDKTLQFISKEGLENSSAKMIEVGDLIYALYGATSGEVAISKIRGAINQAVLCIRTNMNNVFLYNFLVSKKESIVSTFLQGGQGNLSADIVKALHVPMPSPNEQKKIANFLTSIDLRLQTLKKKKSLLEQYKKGVMQKIFSQELRFKDEKGKNFPKWESKKLGELGTFFSGGTPLTTKRQYFDGTIPFIRSGEINLYKTLQFISEEGLKNSSAKMIEAGDLIYALYGATSGEVAISKIRGAINQAVLCIRTSMNNVFLYNYLVLKKDSIVNTYLQGGQGNLSADIVRALKVPIPSPNEQKKIAYFLSSIDDKIDHCNREIKKTEYYKRGLLQKMFV